MEFNRRHFLGAATAASATAFGTLLTSSTSALARAASHSAKPLPATAKLAEQPPLLGEAMAALDTHNIPQRDLLGVVDFSVHSSKRRFQLVDIANGRILSDYLVAHGRGSDPANTGWAKKFSNRPGSNASSRGSYLVSNSYYGKHGHSRRLVGLDPSNNAALERAIVLHGASYVDHELIDIQGHIGRSLGCFAVAEQHIGEVMDRLGEGRLLFAST